jgi:hypothetical protein
MQARQDLLNRIRRHLINSGQVSANENPFQTECENELVVAKELQRLNRMLPSSLTSKNIQFDRTLAERSLAERQQFKQKKHMYDLLREAGVIENESVKDFMDCNQVIDYGKIRFVPSVEQCARGLRKLGFQDFIAAKLQLILDLDQDQEFQAWRQKLTELSKQDRDEKINDFLAQPEGEQRQTFASFARHAGHARQPSPSNNEEMVNLSSQGEFKLCQDGKEFYLCSPTHQPIQLQSQKQIRALKRELDKDGLNQISQALSELSSKFPEKVSKESIKPTESPKKSSESPKKSSESPKKSSEKVLPQKVSREPTKPTEPKPEPPKKFSEFKSPSKLPATDKPKKTAYKEQDPTAKPLLSSSEREELMNQLTREGMLLRNAS